MSKGEELARAAYRAYGKAVGYKNFQGNPMPAYDRLGVSIQLAWESAALAVYGRACHDMADRIVAAAGDTAADSP